MLHFIKLLGTIITSEKEEKILEYVVDRLQKGGDKLFITTPNPEILVYASAHPDYKDKLNSSDVSLPDGVGLQLAGWILGRPLQSRVTGTDFIEKLCFAAREKPMSMGFLGGRGGVAEIAAHRLQQKYPWINVAWVGEEWTIGKNDTVRSSYELQRARSKGHGAKGTEQKDPYALHSMPYANIDILFVAFGHPRQEEWIYENLPHLPVKAAMGVGGAFDYISGRVPRAPKLLRTLGLEWLFRLVIQPWRWKRQLALVKFLFLILRERFKN